MYSVAIGVAVCNVAVGLAGSEKNLWIVYDFDAFWESEGRNFVVKMAGEYNPTLSPPGRIDASVRGKRTLTFWK